MMEKLNVKTKKMPNGDWSCYTTFKGTDKAFVDNSIIVVHQMADWVFEIQYEGEIIWQDPVIHEQGKKLLEPQVTHRASRIDKGMV